MSANWFSVSKATLIDILTKLTAVFDTKADASHSHTKNDITDFPTLGTAATKDVPSSGNATSSQVVMGNDTRLSDSRPASDVYTWAKAASKPTYTASEVGAIASTLKGANNGVAELDSNGKVPSSQLPSYVDDVIEGYYNSSTDRFYQESTFTTVIPPESGKSWVDIPSNKSYRWTGSVYTRVDEGVQLGETSSTAYRGDRGKTAYDHSQLTSGNPHNVTKSDVGLSDVGNFKAVSTVVSQGLTDTEKSNARANIGAGTSSLTIGTTASTAAAGNHTHGLSIAADSGTSALDMAANTVYKLTAGGKTFIFKTPADNDHYTWADITGKPSSYPPSTHTHTKSQITDFPSTMPPSSHTHGNIQNGGTLQTNDVAIANGDKLVITDSSDSSKIARSSITFDGSTATKCLTQKGTWENFTNNAGTITGIKMNGSTVGSSGVVDLGTVITSHQDISGKVNKAGDTMTGQLKTSFKSSVAMGSLEATSKTVVDLCNELRYSSGCCGSANIRTYTGSPSSISAGWYNFIWIPHRSGGVNGSASGDNCDYGRLMLLGMTVDGEFEIRYARGNIAYCRELISSANISSQSVNYATTAGSAPASDVYAWAKAATKPSYSWSEIGSKPTSFTPSSHTHGNIQNGGTLQTNDITIANGDKLVVTDSSDSSKIARASISFDGSTATKCLTQKGTWESFTNNANNAVTQTETANDDNYYEVLLSGTADNTTRTEGAKKSDKLVFNTARGVMYCYNQSSKIGWSLHGGSGASTQATLAYLNLGNSTASGTAGNRYGKLKIYSKQAYYSEILTADTYTNNRTFTLPDKSGTIALTSDIPSYGTSVSGNYLVQRDANGYIYANFVNLGAAAEMPGSYGNIYACCVDTNGWTRKFWLSDLFGLMLSSNTPWSWIFTYSDKSNWVTNWTSSQVSGGGYVVFSAPGGSYGINCWLSDTKLKKNIAPTEKTALDKVDKIDFIQFDWKKDDKHVDLGVSANQIEEFMPDAVWNIDQTKEKGNDFDILKNIDTGKMATYALKAIQELHEIVKKQQEEIDELKSMLV